jgi:hypothetical protein
MKKIFFLILFCVAFFLFSPGQILERWVMGFAGNSDTIESCLIEWTAGEPVAGTILDADCIVSQGFHQSYFQVLEIPETTNSLQGIRVYPNPTVDLLNVDMKGIENLSEVEITLQNMDGKLLLQKSLEGKEIFRLHLQSYEEGMMILRVTDPGSGAVTSFKIIKVNH